MSCVIIVKLERNEKNELVARNFNRRHQQSIPLTAEIEQLLGQRIAIFAQARLTGSGQLIILRRARDRSW